MLAPIPGDKVVKSEQAKKGVTQTLRLTLSHATVTHDTSFQKIDEHKSTMQLAGGTADPAFPALFTAPIQGS
jgi:hypothetical protein